MSPSAAVWLIDVFLIVFGQQRCTAQRKRYIRLWIHTHTHNTCKLNNSLLVWLCTWDLPAISFKCWNCDVVNNSSFSPSQWGFSPSWRKSACSQNQQTPLSRTNCMTNILARTTAFWSPKRWKASLRLTSPWCTTLALLTTTSLAGWRRTKTHWMSLWCSFIRSLQSKYWQCFMQASLEQMVTLYFILFY